MVGGNGMDSEKYFSSIEEFNEVKPAHKIIKSALSELLPTKGNRFGFVFSIIIGFIFAYIVGSSVYTISNLEKITYNIMGVLLALFGCVFSVYSIILAFLSDSYIKKLCEIDYNEQSSYLKKSTSYYEAVLFLYFIAIVVDLILMLLVNSIEPNYVLTSNDFMNTTLAICLLWLFFSFIFRVVYEIKSTIYNTLVLFRASIAYKLLAFAKQDKGKTEE